MNNKYSSKDIILKIGSFVYQHAQVINPLSRTSPLGLFNLLVITCVVCAPPLNFAQLPSIPTSKPPAKSYFTENALIFSKGGGLTSYETSDGELNSETLTPTLTISLVNEKHLYVAGESTFIIGTSEVTDNTKEINSPLNKNFSDDEKGVLTDNGYTASNLGIQNFHDRFIGTAKKVDNDTTINSPYALLISPLGQFTRGQSLSIGFSGSNDNDTYPTLASWITDNNASPYTTYYGNPPTYNIVYQQKNSILNRRNESPLYLNRNKGPVFLQDNTKLIYNKLESNQHVVLINHSSVPTKASGNLVVNGIIQVEKNTQKPPLFFGPLAKLSVFTPPNNFSTIQLSTSVYEDVFNENLENTDPHFTLTNPSVQVVAIAFGTYCLNNSLSTLDKPTQYPFVTQKLQITHQKSTQSTEIFDSDEVKFQFSSVHRCATVPSVLTTTLNEPQYNQTHRITNVKLTAQASADTIYAVDDGYQGIILVSLPTKNVELENAFNLSSFREKNSNYNVSTNTDPEYDSISATLRPLLTQTQLALSTKVILDYDPNANVLQFSNGGNELASVKGKKLFTKYVNNSTSLTTITASDPQFKIDDKLKFNANNFEINSTDKLILAPPLVFSGESHKNALTVLANGQFIVNPKDILSQEASDLKPNVAMRVHGRVVANELKAKGWSRVFKATFTLGSGMSLEREQGFKLKIPQAKFSEYYGANFFTTQTHALQLLTVAECDVKYEQTGNFPSLNYRVKMELNNNDKLFVADLGGTATQNTLIGIHSEKINSSFPSEKELTIDISASLANFEPPLEPCDDKQICDGVWRPIYNYRARDNNFVRGEGSSSTDEPHVFESAQWSALPLSNPNQISIEKKINYSNDEYWEDAHWGYGEVNGEALIHYYTCLKAEYSGTTYYEHVFCNDVYNDFGTEDPCFYGGFGNEHTKGSLPFVLNKKLNDVLTPSQLIGDSTTKNVESFEFIKSKISLPNNIDDDTWHKSFKLIGDTLNHGYDNDFITANNRFSTSLGDVMNFPMIDKFKSGFDPDTSWLQIFAKGDHEGEGMNYFLQALNFNGSSYTNTHTFDSSDPGNFTETAGYFMLRHVTRNAALFPDSSGTTAGSYSLPYIQAIYQKFISYTEDTTIIKRPNCGFHEYPRLLWHVGRVSNQRADAYHAINASAIGSRFEIHATYFRAEPKTVFKHFNPNNDLEFSLISPPTSNIVNPYETRDWQPNDTDRTPVTPNTQILETWNTPKLNDDEKERFLQQLAWSINKPVDYTVAGQKYVDALSGDRSDYFDFIKSDASPTVTECRITVTTFPVLK